MSWEKTNFVILSGKRKSGKDYVAHRLSSRLSASGISVRIIHLSEPIKRAYARLKDLDLDLLLSSAAYKEDYRTEMVRWGEERRTQDPGIFCREALDQILATSEPPAVIIVADARRPSDLNFFGSISSPSRKPLHLRIFASEATRRARGWLPVPAVDEADTECALDDVLYDLLVVNDSSDSLEMSMASAMSLVLKTIST